MARTKGFHGFLQTDLTSPRLGEVSFGSTTCAAAATALTPITVHYQRDARIRRGLEALRRAEPEESIISIAIHLGSII
jgi:hypothetical protein